MRSDSRNLLRCPQIRCTLWMIQSRQCGLPSSVSNRWLAGAFPSAHASSIGRNTTGTSRVRRPAGVFEHGIQSRSPAASSSSRSETRREMISLARMPSSIATSAATAFCRRHRPARRLSCTKRALPSREACLPDLPSGLAARASLSDALYGCTLRTVAAMKSLSTRTRPRSFSSARGCFDEYLQRAASWCVLGLGRLRSSS